jgi:hypothetical protein
MSVESPPSEVLASFQIQRTGQQVRIVDADGSDYEGQVVEPVIVGQAEQMSPLQQRMQTASQQATLPAGKDTAGPAGTANATQRKISGGNSQAQRNGSVNSQANAGELQFRTADNDTVEQNQASATGVEGAILAGEQQAGAGSGFAFQVSGLNRRLNQAVTIIGNCSNVLLPISGSLTAGNLSNQNQARAGANGVMVNSPAPLARPAGSQSQNNFDGSNLYYKGNANTQNAAPAGQVWRVTGQVQIGPTTHFGLDDSTVTP